jgi:hypothetical protein
VLAWDRAIGSDVLNLSILPEAPPPPAAFPQPGAPPPLNAVGVSPDGVAAVSGAWPTSTYRAYPADRPPRVPVTCALSPPGAPL